MLTGSKPLGVAIQEKPRKPIKDLKQGSAGSSGGSFPIPVSKEALNLGLSEDVRVSLYLGVELMSLLESLG